MANEEGHVPTPWHRQEAREPAPWLLACMSRQNDVVPRPLRVIVNHSRAVATHAYLALRPRRGLARLVDGRPDPRSAVGDALRSACATDLAAAVRPYGGGLQNLELSGVARLSTGPVLAALLAAE